TTWPALVASTSTLPPAPRSSVSPGARLVAAISPAARAADGASAAAPRPSTAPPASPRSTSRRLAPQSPKRPPKCRTTRASTTPPRSDAGDHAGAVADALHLDAGLVE